MTLSPDGMVPPAERALLLRLGELRFRVFAGAPVVQVSPERWQLHPQAIRQTAAARRYVETAPDQPGCLRFAFAPQYAPPPFDRPPGTARNREKLAKLLRGEAQRWVSLRRLRLGRADVAEVAAAHGFAVAHEVADPTDRLLLLRRRDLPAGPPARGHRISADTAFTSAVILHLLTTFLAAAAGIYRGWSPGLITLTVLALVTTPLTLLLICLSVRTAGLPGLDAPFDGRPMTTLPFVRTGISAELMGEVASLYGYFHGGPYTGNSRSPWSLSLYVKCRPEVP